MVCLYVCIHVCVCVSRLGFVQVSLRRVPVDQLRDLIANTDGKSRKHLKDFKARCVTGSSGEVFWRNANGDIVRSTRTSTVEGAAVGWSNFDIQNAPKPSAAAHDHVKNTPYNEIMVDLTKATTPAKVSAALARLRLPSKCTTQTSTEASNCVGSKTYQSHVVRTLEVVTFHMFVALTGEENKGNHNLFVTKGIVTRLGMLLTVARTFSKRQRKQQSFGGPLGNISVY